MSYLHLGAKNRTLEMSTKELIRKTVIDRVMDKRMTQKEALEKLHINRTSPGGF